MTIILVFFIIEFEPTIDKYQYSNLHSLVVFNNGESRLNCPISNDNVKNV